MIQTLLAPMMQQVQAPVPQQPVQQLKPLVKLPSQILLALLAQEAQKAKQ